MLCFTMNSRIPSCLTPNDLSGPSEPLKLDAIFTRKSFIPHTYEVSPFLHQNCANNSFVSHTYGRCSRKSFVPHTYAKTGGGGAYPFRISCRSSKPGSSRSGGSHRVTYRLPASHYKRRASYGCLRLHGITPPHWSWSLVSGHYSPSHRSLCLYFVTSLLPSFLSRNLIWGPIIIWRRDTESFPQQWVYTRALGRQNPCNPLLRNS